MKKIEKYQKGANAGDNEFSSFVNFAVKKKIAGKYKRNRFLMVCGYVLFGLVYITLFTAVIKMPMVIAILPVLTWILTYFTWMYVSIDYEYTIVAGVFKAMEVYGMRKFSEICQIRISAMSRIAPYTGEYQKEADNAEKRYYCVSAMDAPDIYFGRFTDTDGKEAVVFFEATEKTLKCIKYYNSDVILSKTRY